MTYGFDAEVLTVWIDAYERVNTDRAGLQVRDRGAGFDTQEALRRGTSSGLTGMKERAELLGGEFILESMTGGGTCLTVELPLSQAVEAGGEGI